MALASIVERFTQRSPVTVMVRRTLEHALSSQWIDEVFEAQRDKQYTRELLFSSVVDLMGLVAMGLRPSLHAAAQSDPDLTVSLAALYLDAPTEDGETIIRLLTNVPTEKMSALEVAELYRKRWKIEGMFGELEAVLESEVRSLGKPRAALLAFGVAVLAYNALSVVKSAVEASHDLEASNMQVSTYYIAAEVKYTYGGMMVMVEPEEWAVQEVQSAEQLSAALLEMAKKVKPATLRKHPRAAKKKAKKGYAPGEVVRKHVATARVLKGEKLS